MTKNEARLAAGSIVAGAKDTTERVRTIFDDSKRLAVMDAERREATIAEVLRDAGVPARYLDRSFATYHRVDGTRGGLEAARRAAEESSGLLLLGRPGVGKTHIAVAILRRRVDLWLTKYPEESGLSPAVYYTRSGERVEDPDDIVAWTRPAFRSRFVVVPDLLDAMRLRITEPGPDPLAPLITCSLLVLDDLGREKASEWVLDRLYRLVNARYNERLATVATTNFGLDDLARRGYEPMVSRLVEDAAVVRLTASDYRMGQD